MGTKPAWATAMLEPTVSPPALILSGEDGVGVGVVVSVTVKAAVTVLEPAVTVMV